MSKEDTPEMIQTCLSCTWDECWNCLGRKDAYCIGLRIELGDEKLIRSILRGAMRREYERTDRL